MLEAGRLRTERRGQSLIGSEQRRRGGGDVPILEVTLALGSDLARNSDRSTTVGDAGREVADVAGLVATSEAEVVAEGREKRNRDQQGFEAKARETVTDSSP